MKLGITYLMKNTEETAETYIELPVMEELEYLAHGEPRGICLDLLRDTIRNICLLQGYAFVCIETIHLIN